MKKNKKLKRQKRKQKNDSKSSSQNFVIDWEGIIIFTTIAVLFSGAILLDGASIIIGLMIGLFIAFAGLQYIDPKKWKPRPLASSVLGGAIGCVLAIEASANWEIISLSVLAGLIVGLFAANWVQYISLP